jgi:hypothetical protein
VLPNSRFDEDKVKFTVSWSGSCVWHPDFDPTTAPDIIECSGCQAIVDLYLSFEALRRERDFVRNKFRAVIQAQREATRLEEIAAERARRKRKHLQFRRSTASDLRPLFDEAKNALLKKRLDAVFKAAAEWGYSTEHVPVDYIERARLFERVYMRLYNHTKSTAVESIMRLYGLRGDEPMSFVETAKAIGVSDAAVRNHHQKFLRVLNHEVYFGAKRKLLYAKA